MNKFQRQPAGFWKIFGASALSTAIIGTLVGIVVVGIISFMIFRSAQDFKSIFKSTPIKVNEGSVLVINSSLNISDRSYSELNQSTLSLNTFTGILDVVESIKAAKNDERIKGIVLDLRGLNIGLAQAYELRQALLDFKDSDKFVVAYSDGYSQKELYLASAAEERYLYPTGRLELKGFHSSVSFYKDFLDKYNLEMQVIRGSNNKFKSAVEPFLMNKMSDANRTQIMKFLSSFWSVYREAVSESVGIEAETLDSLAENLSIRNAQDAVTHELVTDVLYQDEFNKRLKELAGTERSKNVPKISLSNYTSLRLSHLKSRIQRSIPNIAVIYASGGISGGTSGPGSIGDATLVKAIKDAHANPMVQGIVLRVNSPGGDALASDLIWDALKSAGEDKPVVVSMGNVAASGGYYIACNADKIYATPMTVTGSIGVFMVVPNVGPLMEKDLGIHFSRVKTHDHADMSYLELSSSSFTRSLTDDEKLILQQGVNETYKEFLARVADGRETFGDISEVDSIGQGRIWSGTDALEIGLIDELGTLSDAISYLKEELELNAVNITEYPRFELQGLSKILDLMNQTSIDAQVETSSNVSKFFIDRLSELKALDDMGRVQARMLWNIVIE